MRRRADGFRDQTHLIVPPAVIDAALRQPITRDLLPTAAGHFPRASGHFIARASGTDDFIAILCVAGVGWIEARQGLQSVRAGELVILPPGDPHGYGAATPAWTIYWCHFRGSRAADYAAIAAPRFGEPVSIGPSARALAGLALVIQVMQHGYGRIDLVRAATALGAWIGQLQELRTEARNRGGDTGERILAAARWLRENVAEKLTVADAARVAGLSPSHFSTLFRERLGYSPLDFQLRARVQRACELFVAAPGSVANVAAAVGFTDPLYFSRVFRRIMGEPPSDYIARARMHRERATLRGEAPRTG